MGVPVRRMEPEPLSRDEPGARLERALIVEDRHLGAGAAEPRVEGGRVLDGAALERLGLDEGLDLGALAGEELVDELARVARGAPLAQRVHGLLQLGRHLGGGGVAILALVGQRLHADGVERGGDVGDHRGGARQGAVDDPLQDGHVGDALEEALAGEHLPEDHPHREDVDAAVDLLAHGLLRRHVGDLALEHAGARLRRRAQGLGDAEVDDLHLPGVRHEDVVRRGVAVDDLEGLAVEVLELVGVVEAGERVDEDAERHAQGEPARGADPAEDAVEGLPLQELHADVEALAVAADLVGLHHVGVVEAGGEARLVEEHGQELRVLGELLPDLLDDHQLVEARRARGERQEDLRHAPLTELGDRPVLGERPSCALGVGHLGPPHPGPAVRTGNPVGPSWYRG